MVLSGSPSRPIHLVAGDVHTLAKWAKASTAYPSRAVPAEVRIRLGERVSSERARFADGKRAGELADRLPQIRIDQQVRADCESRCARRISNEGDWDRRRVAEADHQPSW